jgi:hypothetical protein
MEGFKEQFLALAKQSTSTVDEQEERLEKRMLALHHEAGNCAAEVEELNFHVFLSFCPTFVHLYFYRFAPYRWRVSDARGRSLQVKTVSRHLKHRPACFCLGQLTIRVARPPYPRQVQQ